MPVTPVIPEPKPAPEKAEWPLGTYKQNYVTFDEFAQENFIPGTPTVHTKKEVRKPMLIYTPEQEKDAVIKIWRVLMRYMGDMLDYRQDYELRTGHQSNQPDMGSVMTRLCRVLGTQQKDNPFGPQTSQREPVVDIPMQTLPYKPRKGTFRRLKDTITQRIFGKGRKTVFHLLPLEETLRTQLERVQFIVGYGILRPRLRDEIYCALCRQLRHNQYKDGVKKGWQLMNLITGCFPPSHRCLDAILNFLDTGPKIHTAMAKSLLQRTMKNGDRLHPPSSIELDAVIQYKPMELEVHMTKQGESISVPVDGASTAQEVCQAAYKRVDLHNTFGMHLFVTTRSKITSLGCGRDHVMDAISQVEQISRDQQLDADNSTWRLYLRKELFEPKEDFTADPKATNLIYEQLKWSVINHDLEFAQAGDLAEFLAKVAYVEFEGTLDTENLKEKLVKPWVENQSNFDELTERRVYDETQETMEAIQTAFSNLYANLSTKPNTFNVKIDIIEQAYAQWSHLFRRIYDASILQTENTYIDDVINDEDSMTGVTYLSVHGEGVSFLSDTYLEIRHLAYTQILQLKQTQQGANHPPILVFIILDDDVIECVTSDADDVTELVSFYLTGLTDRSTYAVATVEHIASGTSDLDLKPGDLIVLNRCAGDIVTSQSDDADVIYTGTNQRTGQRGNATGSHLHVLPTLKTPPNDVLDSYKTQDHILS